VNPLLASLLLDLSGLSDEEAEKLVYQEYIRLYMDRETRKGMIGIRKTHDGEDVLFTEWRFDHAFFKSAYKTSRKFNKGKFSKQRAARINWIEQIIAGTIDGCEFCHVPDFSRHDSSGRVMVKRLYILWEECYLVWLEPREKGGWWFPSTYVENRGRKFVERNVIVGCARRKIPRD